MWGTSLSLNIFRRNILQYVFHPAFQNTAQGVKGGSRDRLSMLHPVQSIRRDPMFEDQSVFRNPPPKKSFIERLV